MFRVKSKSQEYGKSSNFDNSKSHEFHNFHVPEPKAVKYGYQSSLASEKSDELSRESKGFGPPKFYSHLPQSYGKSSKGNSPKSHEFIPKSKMYRPRSQEYIAHKSKGYRSNSDEYFHKPKGYRSKSHRYPEFALDFRSKFPHKSISFQKNSRPQYYRRQKSDRYSRNTDDKRRTSTDVIERSNSRHGHADSGQHESRYIRQNTRKDDKNTRNIERSDLKPSPPVSIVSISIYINHLTKL